MDKSEIARSIPQACRDAAADSPGLPAITDDVATVTFAELDALRRRVGRALVAIGVSHGERVAVWAPNSHEWVAAALGVQSVGAILVPISTRMKGIEAAEILSRSDAVALFSIGDFLGQYFPSMLPSQARARLRHLVVLRDEAGDGDLSWDAFLAHGDAVPESDLDTRTDAVSGDDFSDLLFTSGTTGHPKGVPTTHHQSLRETISWCNAVGLRHGERHLVVPPFFHAFGLKAGWLADLLRRAVCLPQYVFDPDVVLERIARDSINVISGPPALFQGLLAHPRLKEFDLSSLRLAVTGASNIPPVLIGRIRSELGFRHICSGYGLTESGGFGTMCDPEDPPEVISNTVGKPFPDFEVGIKGPDGALLGPDLEGEVVIRGYAVMHGYWNDPVATAATIDNDGWLHTGDVGKIRSDGNLRITDRLKDMYISGGFNCYPAEIERLLAAHPGIDQVAVIGLPDDKQGEVGRAYVVRRAGVALSEAELIDWSRARMSNYKTPRSVVFLDALPVSPHGKVLKRTLRDAALDKKGKAS